jgi:16S rRNA (cytidine1402-2'-O)-methyltransferase
VTPPKARLFLVPAPLDFGCDRKRRCPRCCPTTHCSTAARLTTGSARTPSRCEPTSSASMRACPGPPLQELHGQELPRGVHKKGDHAAGGFDASPLLAPAWPGATSAWSARPACPPSPTRAVGGPGRTRPGRAEVVPLVGPVSLLLALAASGLNGQNFAFVGYLPVDGPARARASASWRRWRCAPARPSCSSRRPTATLTLWQALLQTLQHNTRVAISSGPDTGRRRSSQPRRQGLEAIALPLWTTARQRCLHRPLRPASGSAQDAPTSAP